MLQVFATLDPHVGSFCRLCGSRTGPDGTLKRCETPVPLKPHSTLETRLECRKLLACNRPGV
eukprot:6494848-Prymnesium_polylepis.1